MEEYNLKFILFLFIILSIVSCAPKTIVDGETTYTPTGYTSFCLENPYSIFCKQAEERH